MFATRFATRVVQSTGKRYKHTTLGGFPKWLQDNVWRKSMPLYLSYVIAGAFTVEFVFGNLGDWLWDVNNQGKLYKQIDWSKFKAIEDDE